MNIIDSSDAVATLMSAESERIMAYNRAIRSNDIGLAEYLSGDYKDNTADLEQKVRAEKIASAVQNENLSQQIMRELRRRDTSIEDRKSTRLNSSH